MNDDADIKIVGESFGIAAESDRIISINYGHVPQEIIDRYDAPLAKLGFRVAEESDPGTSGHHLRWMLATLNTLPDAYKAHRWLGFIQGVLVLNGMFSVPEERNFTRGKFPTADAPLLTEVDKELFAFFAEELDNHMSAAGSNDFKWPNYVSPELRKVIIDLNLGKDSVYADYDHEYTYDWFVFNYLTRKILDK